MTTCGIDVGSKYEDINRIVRSKFYYVSDVDDLVQETALKILTAGRGENPFDPDKSSFSHYVFVVARSILLTEIKKRSKNTQPENYSEHLTATGWKPLLNTVEAITRNDMSKRIFLLAYLGYTNKEVMNLLGISHYRIIRERKILKEALSAFLG